MIIFLFFATKYAYLNIYLEPSCVLISGILSQPTYLFGVHFYSIVQRIPSNLSTLLKSKYKFRIIAKIELTTIIGKVFGFPLEHLILPFNLSTLQTSQSKNILIVQTRCRFLLF